MIYLFDVDGTLTPSRQKMNSEFKKWFINFVEEEKVFLVTGSNVEKTIEQVGEEIISLLTTFSCSGNQIVVKGKIIYENEWCLPTDAFDWLEDKLLHSPFKIRTGNHIEKRPGMVNFSVVGRNANKDQRQLYFNYDQKNKERKEIVQIFNKTFPDLEARVGGETGIDISQKGFDKSQVLQNFNGQVSFFGDSMEEDGNDYPLKKAIEDQKRGISNHVKSWSETWSKLKWIKKNY